MIPHPKADSPEPAFLFPFPIIPPKAYHRLLPISLPPILVSFTCAGDPSQKYL